MTDPKGSDSTQEGASASTEKKTAGRRSAAPRKTTAEKADSGKEASGKAKPKGRSSAAPAATGADAKAPAAKKTSGRTSAAAGKKAPAQAPTKTPAAVTDAAAGANAPQAAKPARPARAPRASEPKKITQPKAATPAAPVVAEPAGEAKPAAQKPAPQRSSRRPAAKKAAPAQASAPSAERPADASAEALPAAASAASPEAPAKDPKSGSGRSGSARGGSGRGRSAGAGRPPRPQASEKPAGRQADASDTAKTDAPAPESAATQPAGETLQAGGAENDGSEERNGEKKRRSRSRRGRRKPKNPMRPEESAESTALGTDLGEGLGADAPSRLEAAGDIAPSADFDDDQEDDESEDDEPTGGRGRGWGESEKSEAVRAKLPRRKMFVCVQPEEQVEVVITEEGQVQEYYVEMLHQAKTKGNIYKASVSNVDANLQAAFINYGAVKNGFLQIDEVHPEYYVASHEAGKGRKYPPIQKVLKPGQELLVQVVKEPTGTKGAFLTTYLSLPGRFLVLTPGREQIGVSRKVENEAERARLREMLGGLTPGPGLGVIVRTVSMGVETSHLAGDLENLKQRWLDVRSRGTAEPCPTLIYQEMDLVARAVRDYLTDQVVEVWVDDEKTARAVADVAAGLFPRKSGLVRTHGKDQSLPLFERFNIQRQVEQIHSREVSLPSGGRLVIDPTEALTAIDINSGRSGGKNNFEDMAYRTNIEAARMIPLQLRLRDIGGQVVVDFIEMRDKNHWREVEKTVRQGMKVDRARYDVGKMGPFGMLEIVRQRLGSSAISVSTEPCPHCKGTGVRRNMEWQSQQVLREIQRLMQAAGEGSKESKEAADHLVYEAEPDLALHLLNQKRRRLAELEQIYAMSLEIRFKSILG